MKTKLNQVAIFSLANCERILTNNTDKSLCLKNFGEDLIRQVRKDDWSEKTTLKIREYLDNCYTSVNTMRESRRPFTSRLGEIHKRFVAQENAIDPEEVGGSVTDYPVMSKRRLADIILDRLAECYGP